MQEITTKTSAATKVGVTIALIGAAAMAAAGIVGIQQGKKLKTQSQEITAPEQDVQKLVDDYDKVVKNEKNGLIVEGIVTRTIRKEDVDQSTARESDKQDKKKKKQRSSVKRVHFLTQVEKNVTQSQELLRQYENWPLRPNDDPNEPTQFEEQHLDVTRIIAEDLPNDQREGTKKEPRDNYDNRDQIGSYLYIDAGSKRWVNDATKPMDEYKVGTPYEDAAGKKHIRMPLTTKITAREAISTFVKKVQNTKPMKSIVLNPNEIAIRSSELSGKDINDFMSHLQGLGYYEFLPDEALTKPYIATVVFDLSKDREGTGHVHEIYWTGSDVSGYLQFAVGNTYLKEIKQWIPHKPTMNYHPYFLDNAATDSFMKNYSMYYLSEHTPELNRWFFVDAKKPEEDDMPTDDNDPYDPGDGTTADPDGDGTDDDTNDGDDTDGDDDTQGDNDLPDLVINSLTFDAGDNFTIQIANDGKVDVDKTAGDTLYVWLDGTLRWTYNTITWNCQDFRTVGKSCDIQPGHKSEFEGAHTAKVCADASGVVTESDEGNNCRFIQFDDDHTTTVDEVPDEDTEDGIDEEPEEEPDPTEEEEPEEFTCEDTDHESYPTSDALETGVVTYSETLFKDFCYVDPITKVEVPLCDAVADPNCMLHEYVCESESTMGYETIDCEEYGPNSWCEDGHCTTNTDTPLEVDTPTDIPDPITGDPIAVTGVNTYTATGDFMVGR